MAVVPGNYHPGDPMLIDQIVCELKSQGIFDTFRKECIADVDTKPAYQNLRQRVEGSVTGFLRKQIWRPDMNKNQVREMLRKNIYESGFLETGVERIVDQVVNPKMNTVFLPKVTDVVYKYLGVRKPNEKEEIKEEIMDTTSDNLLPQDLDAISPESGPFEKKDEKLDDCHSLDDSKIDEDESPPFEPIEEHDSYLHHEENSVDSHMSGFSGLMSHESNQSDPPLQIDMSQDSQMSKHSSDGQLSVVLSDGNTKLEVNDEVNLKSNSENELKNNVKKLTDDKVEKSNDKIEKSSEKIEKSNEKIERRDDKEKRDDRYKDKYKSDRHRSRNDSKSDRKYDKKDSKYSSKDRDKSKDDKDKSKDDKHRDDKSKDKKDSKSRSDYKSSSKSSSNRHSSSSSSRDKSSSKKDSSSSKDRGDNKDKSRDKSSSKDSKSRDDKSREDKSRDSSKSRDDRSKSTSKSDSKYRKDDRTKSSSSSSRRDKDKKDTKKRENKDDHFSSKHRPERRSTDRDSNDGSGIKSSSSSYSESNSSSQNSTAQNKQEGSGSTTTSNDSGNSEAVEHRNPITLTNEEIQNYGEINLGHIQPLKLIKPKFASNIHEARRLMKIRKQLKKIEKQSTLALDVLATADKNIERHIQHDKYKPNILKKTEKLTQSLKITIPEIREPSPEPITPPLRIAVSAASWDALEAKLNQNINYDTYYDLPEDNIPTKAEININNENNIIPIQENTKSVSPVSPKNNDQNIISDNTTEDCRFFTEESVDEFEILKKINADCISKLEMEINDWSSKIELSISNNIPGAVTCTVALQKEEVVEKKIAAKKIAVKRKLSEGADIKNMKNNNNLLVRVNSHEENFSLPLSPSESDNSIDKKTDSEIIIEPKPKRQNIYKTQRYSSEDLYKPRPLFKGSTTRRRAAKID